MVDKRMEKIKAEGIEIGKKANHILRYSTDPFKFTNDRLDICSRTIGDLDSEIYIRAVRGGGEVLLRTIVPCGPCTVFREGPWVGCLNDLYGESLESQRIYENELLEKYGKEREENFGEIDY